MTFEAIGKKLALAGTGIGLVLVSSKLIQRKGMDLQGQVVLITGGSRGLGLALAEEFARQGARLVLCSRSNEELSRAQEHLTQWGADVLAIPCDVADPEQVQSLIDQASEHYGQIDILVNNAGIISVGPIQTMTRKDFEDAMDIMFWGTYNTTMAILPQMLQRRSGHITNITSIGGKVSIPHLLPYASAKFAAVGFSQGLRAELAKEGIKVTTIVPGLMRTGSHVNVTLKGNKHQEEYIAFSILDTLPFTSISVRSAAKQIVAATRRGSAEVVLSIQAQVLAYFHGIFPGTTSNIMALTNRFLPSGADAGTESHTGKESETPLTQSFLTVLGQKAARRYNELDEAKS
ncbi:MAG: SDR family NAD(P)-dependent oxidoreductase [Ktedonobacteraceae bacterium]